MTNVARGTSLIVRRNSRQAYTGSPAPGADLDHICTKFAQGLASNGACNQMADFDDASLHIYRVERPGWPVTGRTARIAQMALIVSDPVNLKINTDVETATTFPRKTHKAF
jgi:hypothetical protein